MTKKSRSAAAGTAAKKRSSTSAAASGAAAVDVETAYQCDWKASTFSVRDLKKCCKLGVIPQDKDSVVLPGTDARPNPPQGFRVMFMAFLLRGLSLQAHKFLRCLLFSYGIQLWQLTPNSILHLAIFITICESFLGIHPHWGLWKRVFFVKAHSKRDGPIVVGGVGFSVRTKVDYLKFPMNESVQGWRDKWFYVKDQPAVGQAFNLAPFADVLEAKHKKSWKNPTSAEEKAEADALLARFSRIWKSGGKEMLGTESCATFLERRIQPLQARSHPMWKYSGVDDATRLGKLALEDQDIIDEVRRFTKLGRNDMIPTKPLMKPFDASHKFEEGFVHLKNFPPSPETGVAPEDDVAPAGHPEASGREEEVAAATSTADDSSEYEDFEEEVESEAFVMQPRAKAPASGSMPLAVSPLASAPPAPRPSSTPLDDDIVDVDSFDDVEDDGEDDEEVDVRPTKKLRESSDKTVTSEERAAPEAEEATEAATPEGPPFIAPSPVRRAPKRKRDDLPTQATSSSPPSQSADDLEKSLMSIATLYRKLEVDNQHLREALAEESDATRKLTEEATKRARDEENARKLAEQATKRAEELDAELANLRDNLAAESERKEAAEKRAAEGEGRLHAAVSSLLESANLPMDNKGKAPLDAVALAEDSSAKVQCLLELTKAMLGKLHKTIFPKVEPPATLVDLVKTFNANTDDPIEGPAEGSGPSSSSGMAGLPFATSRSEQLQACRDRIRALEQQLRVVQGSCAVLRKRSKVASQCQLYALEEMKACIDALHYARLDARKEDERVNAKLNAADAASANHPTFWRDRSAASVFVRLQDRIGQLHNFFDTCTAALGSVWHEMMPLNPKPQNLIDLMGEFCDGQRVRYQVRRQLAAGAKAALALAVSVYPQLDLMAIAAGPPADANGNRMDMEIAVALAEDPAKIIADNVVLDSDPGYNDL